MFTFIFVHFNNVPLTNNSRGRLAQMVERAFGNFCLNGRWFKSRQRQDFFTWNLFPLILDFESLKYAMEFRQVSMSENQSVFTVWAKGAI